MEGQKLVSVACFLLVVSQTTTAFMTTTATWTSNDDEHMSATSANDSDINTDPWGPDTVTQDLQSLSQDHGTSVPTHSDQSISSTVSTVPSTFNNCPPVFEKVLTNRTGLISFTYPKKHCTKEWKWNIQLPSAEDGLVLQFNRISDLSHSDIRVYSYSIYLKRRFTFYCEETFSPLLLPANRVLIILKISPDEKAPVYLKITYTAHPALKMPWKNQSYSTDLYNCSGDVLIPSIFRCNMVQECAGNEDEDDCDYTDQGCGDWVPYRDHCLKIVSIPPPFPRTMRRVPLAPEQVCFTRYGALLAHVIDLNDLFFLGRILRKAGIRRTYVGAKRVRPVSKRLKHLYRFIWQSGAKRSPIAYRLKLGFRHSVFAECAAIVIESTEIDFHAIGCDEGYETANGYICMKPNSLYPKGTSTVSVHLPKPSHHINQFPTKECSDKSVVQKFHPCYLDSGQDTITGSSYRFPLFPCRYGPPVHYTLVCDGNADCIDQSDETDCGDMGMFPQLMFKCDASQLVPALQRCDGKYDCFDESDEKDCAFCRNNSHVSCGIYGCLPQYYRVVVMYCYGHDLGDIVDMNFTFNSFVVSMDGFGLAFLKPAEKNNTEETFHCREGDYYIPSFLLNNGELDCKSGEDENIPIENMTCPGFYRCYISKNCVHPDQVCDGIHHCPYKDDEAYCGFVCPDECLCEGYALVCKQFSNFSYFLQVRYLDLSGSTNLSLVGMEFLELLRVLNLSYCRLDTVRFGVMPQLKELDLSFNEIKNISSFVLKGLPGLKSLNISGNPLADLLDSLFVTFIKVSGLNSLRNIIMRHTQVQSISNGAFSPLTELEVLDIRNNFIDSYDREVFESLDNLRYLYTDDSKLCCPYFHESRTIHCVAPFDELSSCRDLLRQNFFRIFLWLVVLSAILGNASVMLYHMCAAKQSTFSVFRMLVINLCAADFIMGMYLMVIGIVDANFHGVYVAKENAWKRSTMCKMAGVMSFVSSEASAMTVCLITLDRVLVLCFTLKSHFHLTARSSLAACGVLWFVAVTLAVLPLLVGLEFYGVSSICLPLPITRRQFSGQFYSFAIFIIFNFALFIVIGLGQVLIYRAILSAGKAAGTSRGPQEMTIARRLFLVILSDFCCWFPVGVMGLLVVNGHPIPDEVNVWAAIFVLPLNSALNPFLYTFNSFLEKRRAEKLKRDTRKVLAKIQTLLPRMPPSTAEQFVEICIRSNVVKKEKILQMLHQNSKSNKHVSEPDIEDVSAIVPLDSSSTQIGTVSKSL